MSDKDKSIKEFMREYASLIRKHGLKIKSNGWGELFLVKTQEKDPQEIKKMLLEEIDTTIDG
jgi:hypothetical protein